jgi:hypothetical protein
MVFARANVSADSPLGGGSVNVEGGGDFGTSIKPDSPTDDQGSLPSTGRQHRAEEETHRQRFRRMRHHF